MDRLSRKLMDFKGQTAKTVKPERYGINTLKTSKDYIVHVPFFGGVVFSRWPMLGVFPRKKKL